MCYRDAVIGFLKSTFERTIGTHWVALFHHINANKRVEELSTIPSIQFANLALILPPSR